MGSFQAPPQQFGPGGGATTTASSSPFCHAAATATSPLVSRMLPGVQHGQQQALPLQQQQQQQQCSPSFVSNSPQQQQPQPQQQAQQTQQQQQNMSSLSPQNIQMSAGKPTTFAQSGQAGAVGGFTSAGTQSYSTASPNHTSTASRLATSYASPFLMGTSMATYSMVAPAASMSAGTVNGQRLGVATSSAPPGMSISMQAAQQAVGAGAAFPASGILRHPAAAVVTPSSAATWPMPQVRPAAAGGAAQASQLLGTMAGQPQQQQQMAPSNKPMQGYHHLQTTGSRWPQVQMQQPQPQPRSQWPPQYLQQPQFVTYQQR